MGMTQIKAPWTDQQVAALADWQKSAVVHAFTCGNDHGLQHTILIPTRQGWVCPHEVCTYRQDWAHDFMFDPVPTLPWADNHTPLRELSQSGEVLYEDDPEPGFWRFSDVAQRAYVWRQRNYPETSHPEAILNKATEELGEVARALVGRIENRPGRGDVVAECAQTIIVLASLAHAVAPDRNVFREVLAEMERLGA